MFAIIRIRNDHDIHQWDIIECSEDENYLYNKCKEYNLAIEHYKKLQSKYHDWKLKMSAGWQIAQKFVVLEKCPNRKPDGSNSEIWEAITKRNKEKLQKARKIFEENFILCKIPIDIQIFFDEKYDLQNLYCTSFHVVETKNDPWKK